MPRDQITRLDEIGEYVSAQRAAELLNVSDARIRQMAAAGQLGARRWGGQSLMITLADVERQRADRPVDYLHPGPQRGRGGKPRKQKIDDAPS